MQTLRGLELGGAPGPARGRRRPAEAAATLRNDMTKRCAVTGPLAVAADLLDPTVPRPVKPGQRPPVRCRVDDKRLIAITAILRDIGCLPYFVGPDLSLEELEQIASVHPPGAFGS
jgi:hypothetical protein